MTRKLSETDVAEIRRRASLGELHRTIANDYGVARASVTRVVGNGPRTYVRTPVRERFQQNVDRDGLNGCWLWMGQLNHGYGTLGVYRDGKWRNLFAHRLSYELTRGGIPVGLQVDHICRIRRCVNPDHLRLVTNKQNAENRVAGVNSSTGVRGVFWVPAIKRYEAKVKHYGKEIHGGYHTTIEEAEAAAVAIRNTVYTHNTPDRRSAA